KKRYNAKVMRKRYIPWLWRLPLAGLLIFEILVHWNVLPLEPDFTSLGLIITSGMIFAGIELLYQFVIKPEHRAQMYWWTVIPPVLIIFFDAIGDLSHFYSRFHYYDQALHFFGSFGLALFIWNIMTVRYAGRVSAGSILFFSFMTAVALTVFYEIEEYLEDVITGSSRLGDGPDTGNDLSMNALGALTSVLLLRLRLLFVRDKTAGQLRIDRKY
ncbi:MAG: hypothetical protein ABIG66_02850, partial [Candidatus Kerfeldbacteria bacterium]